jgi:hypothetical protein
MYRVFIDEDSPSIEIKDPELGHYVYLLLDKIAELQDKLRRRNKQIEDLKVKIKQQQSYNKYNNICHICFGQHWQDCKCLGGDDCS